MSAKHSQTAQRAERNLLRIDERGQPIILGQSLSHQLSQLSGCYELTQAMGGHLVFSLKGSRQGHQEEFHAPVVLQGSIEAMGSTMEIVNFMNIARMTGQLVFFSQDIRKSLLFHNGEVRGASSSLLEDRLGEILYRFGVVSRADLDHAIETSAKKRRPLGNYLLETGLVNSQELYKNVHRQVEEIFYSTLAFTQGRFAFFAVDPAQIQGPITLNAQSLLMEGLRRIDELGFFRESIPHEGYYLQRRQPVGNANLEALSAQDQLILQSCEQPIPLEELVFITRLGHFETYKIVHRLVKSQWLAVFPPEDFAAPVHAEPAYESLELDEGEGSPDELLGQLIDAFNWAFQRIQQIAAHHRHVDILNQGLQAFLEYYGYAELFEGVYFDESGLLSKTILLQNVYFICPGDPIPCLRPPLTELLHMILFDSQQWLSREEQREIQAFVDQLIY